jgi:hypothetical protein
MAGTISFTRLPLKVLPCRADGRYNSESSHSFHFDNELYFSLAFIDRLLALLTMQKFGAI